MTLQGGLYDLFLEIMNQEKRALGGTRLETCLKMMCCFEDSITLSTVFLLRVLYM